MLDIIATGFVILVMAFLAYRSIKVIRPTERCLKERFGKYNSFLKPGLHFLIPFVDRLVRVNVTEQMVDAKQQEVITKDNLNAGVDAQVYFKVKESEDDVKNSEYAVDDYYVQIVALARTTLRDIIGKLSFKEVNGMRAKLNSMLQVELNKETKSWGISVVRTELKEIEPPSDVQNTMNEIIKAENTKEAAVDFAIGVERKADGEKKATIKKAQGDAQAVELKAVAEKNAKISIATGEAQAIKLVNESAQKYFKAQAVELKKIEAGEKIFQDNTKIIVSEDKPILKTIAEIMALKTEAPEKKKEGEK